MVTPNLIPFLFFIPRIYPAVLSENVFLLYFCFPMEHSIPFRYIQYNLLSSALQPSG